MGMLTSCQRVVIGDVSMEAYYRTAPAPGNTGPLVVDS